MTAARELLLVAALRHAIIEPDLEAGFTRTKSIAARNMDWAEWHDALAACLHDGLIHEPVRLPAGALQCHWRLELTPKGVAAARAILDERGMTADQLLESLRE